MKEKEATLDVNHILPSWRKGRAERDLERANSGALFVLEAGLRGFTGYREETRVPGRWYLLSGAVLLKRDAGWQTPRGRVAGPGE